MSQTNQTLPGNYTPGFIPPSKAFVKNLTALGRAYFRPRFFGMEHVSSDRPALYVTNHSVLGFLDGTLWAAELYLKKDIFCRSLVDDLHYMMPGWKDLAPKLGFVRGSRENCLAMMENGEHIMVYPGGGRETCKRKGEKYRLTWKKRTGFARMALQTGYDIVTVAQVGQEDAYDIVLDGDEIMQSRIGDWLREKGIAEKYLKNGETVFPLVRGIGPTPIPRPERQYYAFGERISTKEYDGRTDEETLWEVRNRVEMQLELDIIKLRIRKLEEGDGNLIRSLLNHL